MTDDESLAWETTSSAVAYECPGFSIVHEDVTLPDGTETDFDYLRSGHSVVLLPFTPDGDLVLVEEWREAVDRVNRALPAGSVEGDEDLAAAARRELTEETGYEAASVEEFATFEPANGVTDAVFHYFLARDCEPTGEQNLDFNESIRVSTEGYDDFLDGVLSGDVRDGRSALGVLHWELDSTGSR